MQYTYDYVTDLTTFLKCYELSWQYQFLPFILILGCLRLNSWPESPSSLIVFASSCLFMALGKSAVSRRQNWNTWNFHAIRYRKRMRLEVWKEWRKHRQLQT